MLTLFNYKHLFCCELFSVCGYRPCFSTCKLQSLSGGVSGQTWNLESNLFPKPVSLQIYTVSAFVASPLYKDSKFSVLSGNPSRTEILSHLPSHNLVLFSGITANLLKWSLHLCLWRLSFICFRFGAPYSFFFFFFILILPVLPWVIP